MVVHKYVCLIFIFILDPLIMSVLMSTVEVVVAAVGLCKVGDCSDRLGVSPDTDGARE